MSHARRHGPGLDNRLAQHNTNKRQRREARVIISQAQDTETMDTRQFSATHHHGKPAVFDQTSRVYYYGYKNLNAARAHAEALNNGEAFDPRGD